VIRGARMHNLQGIDCSIPLGKITAITGVSGSGKSTLAFDILYAEGQRRFVECLSAYARQFLERLERPNVDQIGFIQPPIALKQRVSIKNARSTVGSVTELSDYLRLLLAHAGCLHCLECGGEVVRTGIDDAVAAVRAWERGTRLAIVAPLTPRPDRAGIERLRAQGYTRLFAGDRVVEIDDWLAGPSARRAGRRPLGLVIDRIIVGQARRGRIAEAFETAWRQGQRSCRLQPLEGGTGKVLRGGLACTQCGAPAQEPTPALFSSNSPLGACPTCQGFGRIITVDRDKVVPDPRKNLRNHAVVPFGVPSARGWYRRLLRAARALEIPTDLPFEKLSPEQRDWIFRGDEDFPGVEGFFEALERQRYKMHVRIFIARFRGYAPCPTCRGSRLKPAALAATLGEKNIHELHELTIEALRGFLDELKLTPQEHRKVRAVLESIRARLVCLEEVGVGYLTLGRTGRTLSGGETQRIRIAAAQGNTLTETLFILDEPTVGLHATDTERMLGVLRRMAAMGNTVVVVEHDPEIIAGADHLIVLGPGGGRNGGHLVYEGDVAGFLQKEPDYFRAVPPGAAPPLDYRRRWKQGRARRQREPRLSSPWSAEAVQAWLAQRQGRGGGTAGDDARSAARRESSAAAGTGRALVAEGGRAAPGPRLEIRDAREHNLKIARLSVPLGGLVVITGVSGSGKSTLLDEILYRNWLRRQGRTVEGVGEVGEISGLQRITEAHLVGQDLLGRSSRSNPISFVKAYGEIRKALAGTLLARQRSLDAGAFSFNTPGGRCEACRGMGLQTLEMFFLPDVEVVCETCGGQRFRPEVLAVTWRGKNIDEILKLTVDEATEFFAPEPRVVERLAPLRNVGLGYITLGQSTNTLSGGEAQRLKIAAFLANGTRDERHLFLFDEPTTGLHGRDVSRLLGALRALLGRGHAVIAVEHHLDFIAAADWVIDLGPGPGKAGGRLVYAGPVAGLLQQSESPTGRALRVRLHVKGSGKAER